MPVVTIKCNRHIIEKKNGWTIALLFSFSFWLITSSKHWMHNKTEKKVMRSRNDLFLSVFQCADACAAYEMSFMPHYCALTMCTVIVQPDTEHILWTNKQNHYSNRTTTHYINRPKTFLFTSRLIRILYDKAHNFCYKLIKTAKCRH